MEQIGRVVDLFSGCGGFSQGFVDAGFAVELAIDSDPVASATYRANFGGRVLPADIRTITEESLPEVEVVIGEPPWTAEDAVGAAEGSSTRLIEEFIRLVDFISPDVFVLASGPDFVNSVDLVSLVSRTEIGSELEGYRTAHGLLEISNGGSTLVQQRTVVVGTWTGVPSLPATVADSSIVVDLRERDGESPELEHMEIASEPFQPDNRERDSFQPEPSLVNPARPRGFGTDFTWHGSPAQVARQISNAFPPNLAGAVARHIRDVVLTTRRVPGANSPSPEVSTATT